MEKQRRKTKEKIKSVKGIPTNILMASVLQESSLNAIGRTQTCKYTDTFNATGSGGPFLRKYAKVFAASVAVAAILFFCAKSGYAQTEEYQTAYPSSYHSPYHLIFTYPIEQLLAPDKVLPRCKKTLESQTPFDQWYSARIRRKFGVWGPEPRIYPVLDDFNNIPSDWKRQRLIAVAMKMIGLPYQHHHIPDWNPPADWPWKPVKYGRNSKGVDCSDFSSWVYNYGLGIKLKTGIKTQAESKFVPGPDGELSIRVNTISNSGDYKDLVDKLKTGDLLYIKNDSGNVSHVIMWVGACGKAPGDTPLVIDSTGLGHIDSNGVEIPVGIYLRPFGQDSWYFKKFSHAHRIIKDSGADL